MDISLRSILTAGVTAATATAIVAAPSVLPLPDPRNNEVVVTSAVSPTPGFTSAIEQLQPDRLGPTTPAPQVAIPGWGSQPWVQDLNQAIKNIYDWGEAWVWWAVDNVAYVASWIIPFGWIWEPQVDMLYNFGEAIVQSIVFNLDDWILGPISFFAGLGNVINDSWNALVNLGYAEWNWLVGLIPFFPLPPIFPWNATVQASALDVMPAPTAGPIGNGVIDASQALADVSNAIWDVWNPIKGSIDYGVDWASYALDTVSWIPFVPLANYELNQVWELIEREGDAFTGFAHDMINAGNQAVADFFNAGLITAANNAFWTTVRSINAQGGEAIDALIDFGAAQFDLFTPFTVAPNAQLERTADLAGAAPKLPGLTDLPTPSEAVRDVVTLDVPSDDGDDLDVDTSDAEASLAGDPTTIERAPRNLVRELVKEARSDVRAALDDAKLKATERAEARKAERAEAASVRPAERIANRLNEAGKAVRKAIEKASSGQRTAAKAGGAEE